MMRRRAFTLVELLVVIGIIGLLIGILMPVLSRARAAADKTKCLSNMRQLAVAQAAYASANRNQILIAGQGSTDEQGAWIGMLEPYLGSGGAARMVRRCPVDHSPYFDNPDTSLSPPVLRTTSYAINNYVSPTHAPFGARQIFKITQVRKSSLIIQFVELAENGEYATADHIHVQQFYLSIAPSATLGLINKQMPVGRHGGQRGQWSGVLNYAFLDGHAESLPLKDVYTSPTINRFIPALAP